METAPSESVPGPEQRRSKRFRTSLVVELKHGSKVQKVHTIDVSRHGLFVETPDPPSERFLVQLVIHLPEGPLPATAFVSRRVLDDGQHVPGAGLQLFALAAASKTRWDQFVFSLAGLENRLGQLAAEDRAKERSPNVATFLIKLRDTPRLAEFYEKNVRAGGLFMATPLIKESGADVALIIIHPISEQEFLLMGKVERVCRERPKGMEIKLDKLSDEEREAFKTFVRAGTNPLIKKRSKTDAKKKGTEEKEKDTGDISIDIVVDEEALEESRRFEWSEISNQELIVDDFALVEDESAPPPALTLDSLIARARDPAVTVRFSCSKCNALTRPIDFGGLGGILGVFASKRPYWCPKCEVFVAVARLKNAHERRVIADEFNRIGEATMKTPIELSYAFDLASIAGSHPRCPDCGCGLRVTKAVKQIQSALQKLDMNARIHVKDGRCGECGAKAFYVERVDEIEAHVRIEEPEESEDER
jgi:hypothetical protein